MSKLVHTKINFKSIVVSNTESIQFTLYASYLIVKFSKF